MLRLIHVMSGGTKRLSTHNTHFLPLPLEPGCPPRRVINSQRRSLGEYQGEPVQKALT